jgi:hypothetical protein
MTLTNEELMPIQKRVIRELLSRTPSVRTAHTHLKSVYEAVLNFPGDEVVDFGADFKEENIFSKSFIYLFLRPTQAVQAAIEAANIEKNLLDRARGEAVLLHNLELTLSHYDALLIDDVWFHEHNEFLAQLGASQCTKLSDFLRANQAHKIRIADLRLMEMMSQLQKEELGKELLPAVQSQIRIPEAATKWMDLVTKPDYSVKGFCKSIIDIWRDERRNRSAVDFMNLYIGVSRAHEEKKSETVVTSSTQPAVLQPAVVHTHQPAVVDSKRNSSSTTVTSSLASDHKDPVVQRPAATRQISPVAAKIAKATNKSLKKEKKYFLEQGEEVYKVRKLAAISVDIDIKPAIPSPDKVNGGFEYVHKGQRGTKFFKNLQERKQYLSDAKVALKAQIKEFKKRPR